jgi:hypothetical protein
MATKLNVDTGGEYIGKKLWDKHQGDEYTHVNHYKEAVCINCFKKDAAAATIVMICGDCAGKRGREPLLAKISDKFYGLCYFCSEYKFNLEEINARFCHKCHRKIADVTKAYNKAGGFMYTDPFWKRMRKKNGKDWKEIFTKNLGNKR